MAKVSIYVGNKLHKTFYHVSSAGKFIDIPACVYTNNILEDLKKLSHERN